MEMDMDMDNDKEAVYPSRRCGGFENHRAPDAFVEDAAQLLARCGKPVIPGGTAESRHA